MLSTKQCSKCGRVKPFTAKYFARQNTLKSGLAACCRECRRAYNRQHSKIYYVTHAERLKEKRKQNYRKRVAADPDLNSRYRQKAKRKPDFSERERLYIKKWRAENPDKVREFNARRRARVLAARGKYTAADIEKIMRAQKSRCWWCSIKLQVEYDVDHRIPLSRGGTNGPENLVISCQSCNRRKSTKMPWELETPRLL